MLNVAGGHRIWLCTRPTDMRKSFDGLGAVVRSHLGADPADGHWYAFINRRRTQLKLLAFERGGYCLWSKRLEQGQFAFPLGDAQGKRALSATEFLALIEGMDLVVTRTRKRLEFRPKRAA